MDGIDNLSSCLVDWLDYYRRNTLGLVKCLFGTSDMPFYCAIVLVRGQQYQNLKRKGESK